MNARPSSAGIGPHVATRATVTSAAAAALGGLALDHADALGIAVCVAVVDASGTPLFLRRMDGVAAPIVEFALDKAFTAATMAKSTRDFGQRMIGDAALGVALAGRRRMITWQGGLPIVAGGEIVGGIGVSGATGEEDEACAAAALAALGLGPASSGAGG